MNTLKKLLTDIVNYCINLIKTVFGGIETILKQVSNDPVKLLLLILSAAIVADIVAKGEYGTTQYVISQVSALIKAVSGFTKDSWPILALVAIILGFKK